jgi:hypothetical protein
VNWRFTELGVLQLGTLPQLVAAFWLIIGGAWLSGAELFALLMGHPFNSLQLGGGISLLVGGTLFGAFLLRRLDAPSTIIEDE